MRGKWSENKFIIFLYSQQKKTQHIVIKWCERGWKNFNSNLTRWKNNNFKKCNKKNMFDKDDRSLMCKDKNAVIK